MNAKQKAIELFEKYNKLAGGVWKIQKEISKGCAIIAIDEILKSDLRQSPYQIESPYDYWENVKQEIEKL